MKKSSPIEIQKNGSLPIKCFTGEGLLPDEPAQKQLQKLADFPGLKYHVAVLPDVHFKRCVAAAGNRRRHQLRYPRDVISGARQRINR